MALSLNDLKKNKVAKEQGSASLSHKDASRRMLRPWDDPTQLKSIDKINNESNSARPDHKLEVGGKPVAEVHFEDVSLPNEISSKLVATLDSNRLVGGSQTGSNPVTENNLTIKQSIKTVSKLVANREQTGSKLVANQEQTSSKNDVETSPENKLVAQPVAKKVANWEQTSSKPVAETSISQVVGNERKLLCLVFDECRKEGTLSPPPLTREFIAASLDTSHGTVKSAILRLERKGYLLRQTCKVGRGGWVQLSLPKDTFQKMLLNETGSKLVANEEQSGSKSVAKLVAQPVATSSSSSLSLDLTNNKTTTEDRGLPEEWASIDISELAHIKFNSNHLRQIYNCGHYSASEAQTLIDSYAFELHVNKKKPSSSPLGYFLGPVKDQSYSIPVNFESRQVKAKRLWLESQEKEVKAQADMQERALKVEFFKWNSAMPIEEKLKLVPVAGEFMKPGGKSHETKLREYFEENVWPAIAESLESQF
jgi:hypothetical protein